MNFLCLLVAWDNKSSSLSDVKVFLKFWADTRFRSAGSVDSISTVRDLGFNYKITRGQFSFIQVHDLSGKLVDWGR